MTQVTAFCVDDEARDVEWPDDDAISHVINGGE